MRQDAAFTYAIVQIIALGVPKKFTMVYTSHAKGNRNGQIASQAACFYILVEVQAHLFIVSGNKTRVAFQISGDLLKEHSFQCYHQLTLRLFHWCQGYQILSHTFQDSYDS